MTTTITTTTIAAISNIPITTPATMPPIGLDGAAAAVCVCVCVCVWDYEIRSQNVVTNLRMLETLV